MYNWFTSLNYAIDKQERKSIMKFDSILNMYIKKDLATDSIPMLIGEPGIGKSSWVENLAKELHTKSFTLACNQLADKSDLTGQRLVPTQYTDKNGQTKKTYVQVFYPHTVIQEAINYANLHPDETPILFLDELNRTTPDVTSEALSIPTMRSIGNQKLPNNLKVITAGNDKGNVSSLDKASISRFVLYHVAPDVDTYLNLDPELNPYIKKTLQTHPEDIFKMESPQVAVGSDTDDDDDDDDDKVSQGDLMAMLDDSDSLSQITTPRTISSLSRWLNSFTQDELAKLNQTPDPSIPDDANNVNLLYSGIIAHVGDTTFASDLAEIIDKSLAAPVVNSVPNAMTVQKPITFDALQTSTSRSSMETVIQQNTDKENQNCLLFALYDHHDNRIIIEELLNAIDQFDKDHVKRIAALAASNALDDNNVQTAENIDTPAAQQINSMLQLAN